MFRQGHPRSYPYFKIVNDPEPHRQLLGGNRSIFCQIPGRVPPSSNGSHSSSSTTDGYKIIFVDFSSDVVTTHQKSFIMMYLNATNVILVIITSEIRC